MRLIHPQSSESGLNRENIFQVFDENYTLCGSAAVIEYIQQTLLPDYPLNYYLSISAANQRAFDMLAGAALARVKVLRARHPDLTARLYAPCMPQDTALLQALSEHGFLNDDSVIRTRRISMNDDRFGNTPMGLALAPVVIEDQEDCQALLKRLNEHSVTAFDLKWYNRVSASRLFMVYGMWRDDELIAETVTSSDSYCGKIEMIYVLPEYRRRHIASSLIDAMAKYFLHNGMNTLTADIWRRNPTAVRFFTASGFEYQRDALLYPGMEV